MVVVVSAEGNVTVVVSAEGELMVMVEVTAEGEVARGGGTFSSSISSRSNWLILRFSLILVCCGHGFLDGFYNKNCDIMSEKGCTCKSILTGFQLLLLLLPGSGSVSFSISSCNLIISSLLPEARINQTHSH